MGATFGTSEWAESLAHEINASSEYRNVAARWGVGWNGNILLGFESDAQLPRPLQLLLRLEGGSCTSAAFVQDPAHPDAGFVLRAPFSLWKEILEKRTLAATAILTGRMRVEGDKATLLRFLSAHRALLHCTASLDTVFP